MYPKSAAGSGTVAAEPVRQIMGPDTGIGFVAGVESIPNDANCDGQQRRRRLPDWWVFDYDDLGNVKTSARSTWPHQSWGLALSNKLDEMLFSVQTPNMIVWYTARRQACNQPVRVVRGTRPTMADPHGVAIDDANDEVFAPIMATGDPGAGPVLHRLRQP